MVLAPGPAAPRLRFFSVNPGNQAYELPINTPLVPAIDELPEQHQMGRG